MCKKFLDMNQLVNGVPTQNNKPIPIKILKSKGKIFLIVFTSYAIVITNNALAKSKPPTKPPPGV